MFKFITKKSTTNAYKLSEINNHRFFNPLERINFPEFYCKNSKKFTTNEVDVEKINPKIKFENKVVYLDFQATTPLDPRVLDSMMPFQCEYYGNPHSKSHVYGWNAEDAIEKAREVYFN